MRKLKVLMPAAVLAASMATTSGVVSAEETWVHANSDVTLSHPFHRQRIDVQPEIDAEYGSETLWNNAEFDINRQMTDIDAFIAQGVDILSIDPVDVVAVEPAVRKALAAGIPTYSIFNKVDVEGNVSILVGEYDLFSTQVDIIAALLDGKGKIFHIAGKVGNYASDQRLDAVRDSAAKHEGLELVEWQTSEFDSAKAVEIVEGWLTKYDEIDAIISVDDAITLPVAEILKARGREGILLNGYAGTGEAWEAIEDGTVVVGGFMGPKLIQWFNTRTAYEIVKGYNVPSEVFWQPPVILTEETYQTLVDKGMPGVEDLDWITPVDAEAYNERGQELYGIHTVEEHVATFE